jgi:O-antigen ligase
MIATCPDWPQRIGLAILGFVWGSAINVPEAHPLFRLLYPLLGLNIGDLALLAVLLLEAVRTRRPAWTVPIASRPLVPFAMALLACWSLLACCVNLPVWGMRPTDVVQALRPLYFIALIGFVAIQARAGRGVPLLAGHAVGAIVGAFIGIAYLRERGELVTIAGFQLMFNPNVVGIYVTMSMAFASLLVAYWHRYQLALLLLAPLLYLTIGTFSKGAWFMAIAALVAVVAAFAGNPQRRLPRVVRFEVLAAAILLVVLILIQVDRLQEMVLSKISATGFDQTAAEGSNIGARIGNLKATRLIFLDNPAFGVGLSNFGPANQSLKEELGNWFWDNDNPHNGFAFLLVGAGLPGLAFFLLACGGILHLLWISVPLGPRAKPMFVASIAGMIVVSGNVALLIFAQHALWIIAGVALGGCAEAPARTLALLIPASADTAKG